MPERPAKSWQTLNLIFNMVASAGVVLLLGSLIAYVTGEDLGRVRTHVEATMVLGTMGVACLVAAVFPLVANLKLPKDY